MARTSPALRMEETLRSRSDKRFDRTSQGRPDAVRIPELQQGEGGPLRDVSRALPALRADLRSWRRRRRRESVRARARPYGARVGGDLRVPTLRQVHARRGGLLGRRSSARVVRRGACAAIVREPRMTVLLAILAVLAVLLVGTLLAV